MKLYERNNRKQIGILRISFFVIIYLILFLFQTGKSDYVVIPAILLCCFGVIPVVALDIEIDRIFIKRYFFFGFFSRKYLFVNKYPIELYEFEVEYENAGNNSTHGNFGATLRKYSLTQTCDHESVSHVEIGLSKQELKIIIEQFMKDIETPFSIEY